MGFEPPPPNEFRASLRPGGGRPIIVADKYAQADPDEDGLGAVKVPRSEFRRGDHRGDDRHRLTDEQTIIRHAGAAYDVQLINLSQGGAMVAAGLAVKLWDTVELVLGEGGEVECAVTWMRDGKIGLEFAHETRVLCDSATLDDLLRQVIRNSFPDVQLGARSADPEPDHEQKRGAFRHPLNLH